MTAPTNVQTPWDKRPSTLSSFQSLPQPGPEQGIHWLAGRVDCNMGAVREASGSVASRSFLSLSPWAQPPAMDTHTTAGHPGPARQGSLCV